MINKVGNERTEGSNARIVDRDERFRKLHLTN